MNWPVVKLGDVATIDRRAVNADEIGAGTTYIGLENIRSGGEFTDVNTVAQGVLASTKFSFQQGHILYGRLRPYLGKIARPDFGGVCSTDILPIASGRSLERDYLVHYLRQEVMIRWATSRSTGANLPRIGASALTQMPVPLPPLTEQKRIAALLDQADALRAKRREAIAQLDELTQSIFLDMFGDPATNPKGWLIRTIGESLHSAQYGTSARAGGVGEYPILRMSNITQRGDLDLTNLKFIDIPTSQAERYVVKSGDLLFNRTNSADLVGKTAVYRSQAPMVYAGYLIRLRVNETVDAEFLSAYLNTNRSKQRLRLMCKSIIGMANINAREIQKMPLPVPPLNLQQQFAQRVGAVERAKQAQRAHLNELDALFESLQARAFRGEL